MTVVNPKSISGINSITTGSGSDNLLTIHTSDASSTERVRINSSGDVIVGSGITVSPDGDIFATGVCTATSFSGDGSALTGIDLGAVTGATGDFSIADKIVHTGDTNTAIRFPAADTITTETGGSERLRIDSSGRLLLGTTTEGSTYADEFTVATSANCGITIRSGTSNDGNIFFSDGTSGDDELRGYVQYSHANNFMRFATDAAERVRITSDGKVGINEASPAAALDVEGSGVPMIVNSSNSNTYKIQLENAGSTLGYIGAVTDAIVFSNSSAAEQARFTDAGLKLPSGRGIDFSATSDASGMASELLDDYEEGTFTPNWDAGGGVTFSYNHQYGFYTKIGDTVTFQLYIMGYASTITGGNEGNGVVIQGLPYTILNHSRYYPAFTVGRTYNVQINDNKRVYSYGDSNSTNIRLIQEENDTVGGLLTAVQFDRNPSFMLVGGVYRV